MSYVTVAYKYSNKVYIGVLKGSNIDFYERLYITNANEFSENFFYVMMVGDGKVPDIAEIDRIICDLSTVTSDEEFVSLGNLALSKFKMNATFH